MPNEIDWAKESQSQIKIVPSDTYLVRLKRWEYKSASTGTEQVRWYVSIETEGEYEGNPLIDHIALTDNAKWRLAAFVTNAGIDTKALPKMRLKSEMFGKVMNLCKDRTMYWVIAKTKNPKTGEDQNKVVDYLPDETQDTRDISQELEEIPEFLRKK